MTEETKRTAIITGASRRDTIASAIAHALLDTGWQVFLTGYQSFDADIPFLSAGARDIQALLEELRGQGRGVEYLDADLADIDAPRTIFDSAEARFGSVTALINAHSYNKYMDLIETDALEFDRHMAINVRATVLLCAELGRRFRGRHGTGRIINLTSGQWRGAVGYAASKGALDRITKTCASDLGPRGITANAVDPHRTQTGHISPDLAAVTIGETPLGRLGTPGDTANLVAFLCSDQGGWITGQIIESSGGRMRSPLGPTGAYQEVINPPPIGCEAAGAEPPLSSL